MAATNSFIINLEPTETNPADFGIKVGYRIAFKVVDNDNVNIKCEKVVNNAIAGEERVDTPNSARMNADDNSVDVSYGLG